MTIINKIDRYLVDTVDRIRPTVTAGLRTEETASGLRARIVNRVKVVRDAAGDYVITKMLIYLLPDADVIEGDELVADTLHRPVIGLIEARDKQGTVHHLEAELG